MDQFQDDAFSKMIRNVAICGDYSSGKTTLTNLLFKPIKIDDHHEERQSKTQFYSKNFQIDELDNNNNMEFTINLFDCPGRLETISEVKTTLRLSDGCLLVASLVGPNCLSYQSEMVLREAATERVRSVLMINKLDVLLRSKCSLEDVYQAMMRIIESVNVLITTYGDSRDEDYDRVHPIKGKVAFGSVLGGWSFTLQDFALFYSKLFGMSVEEMTTKLWGDHYYDSNSGHWLNNSKDGTIERGFCQLVLKPIRNILQAKSQSSLEELMKPFGICISAEENLLERRELTDLIRRKWLPASKSILDLIVKQLPSPKEAQSSRVENIYTGSQEDSFGRAIKNCDPCGPLMMHITRCEIFNGQVYAVGRVFSGKLNMVTPIRILNTKFEEKLITRIVKINGSSVERIQEATCGSIVGLQGIETFLTNSGATITESSNREAESFSEMKLQQTMINYIVEPENQTNLPQLIKGMELISKCDPSIQIYLDDSGCKIVSISSETQLQSVLKKFKLFNPSIEIKVEEPSVSFRETITTVSSRETLAKSPNKHNRYFMRAEPMEEGLVNQIESGLLLGTNRDKILTDKFGWNLEDTGNIWSFGPFSNSSNAFVDQTQGLCKLNEIKTNIIHGFNFAMREGPLCAEIVRGVRINLKDLNYPEGSFGRFSRGPHQIISTVRRGCFACMLDSGPTLMEPVLLGEFRCNISNVPTLQTALANRRALVKDKTEWHSIYQIKTYIPITEYFGLSEELNKSDIFSQFTFDHWQLMPIPVDSVEEIINKIRKRKGLSENIPLYSDLADKL